MASEELKLLCTAKFEIVMCTDYLMPCDEWGEPAEFRNSLGRRRMPEMDVCGICTTE